MGSPNLHLNEEICRAFGKAVMHGEQELGSIPGLLKRVLKGDPPDFVPMWRDREVPQLHKVIHFDRFEDWVTTPPLEGIGADMSTVKNLIRDDPKAEALLEATLLEDNPDGGDRRSEAFKQSVADANRDNIVMSGSVAHPVGNSREQALRRLRKAADDAGVGSPEAARYQRVLDGKQSPHRAMLEAGFRRELTPLELLQKAWAKASKEQRDEFLQWVCDH